MCCGAPEAWASRRLRSSWLRRRVAAAGVQAIGFVRVSLQSSKYPTPLNLKPRPILKTSEKNDFSEHTNGYFGTHGFFLVFFGMSETAIPSPL